MSKRALNTGITGQADFCLAERLISRGYEVFGLARGQKNSKYDVVREIVPDGRLLTGPPMDLVPRKLTQAVSPVRLGVQNRFVLGNRDARRGWAYAGDYIDAMWRMRQPEADEYVIATVITQSIRVASAPRSPLWKSRTGTRASSRTRASCVTQRSICSSAPRPRQARPAAGILPSDSRSSPG